MLQVHCSRSYSGDYDEGCRFTVAGYYGDYDEGCRFTVTDVILETMMKVADSL